MYNSSWDYIGYLRTLDSSELKSLHHCMQLCPPLSMSAVVVPTMPATEIPWWNFDNERDGIRQCPWRTFRNFSDALLFGRYSRNVADNGGEIILVRNCTSLSAYEVFCGHVRVDPIVSATELC